MGWKISRVCSLIELASHASPLHKLCGLPISERRSISLFALLACPLKAFIHSSFHCYCYPPSIMIIHLHFLHFHHHHPSPGFRNAFLDDSCCLMDLIFPTWAPLETVCTQQREWVTETQITPCWHIAMASHLMRSKIQVSCLELCKPNMTQAHFPPPSLVWVPPASFLLPKHSKLIPSLETSHVSPLRWSPCQALPSLWLDPLDPQVSLPCHLSRKLIFDHPPLSIPSPCLIFSLVVTTIWIRVFLNLLT